MPFPPSGHSDGAPPVTLVSTGRNGSLELYAEQLARTSPREHRLVRAATHCRSFGVPLISREAASSAAADVRLVRRLRRSDGLVHLTNQHLARYGVLLDRPYVVTVHDLIRTLDVGRDRPYIQSANRRDRMLLRLDAAGIRRAAAVVAVSDSTRHALRDHLGISPERIFTIHQGVDHARFRPVRRRLLADPYVLFVGSEQPRKNLVGVLEALSRLKRLPAMRRLKLVKIGEPGSATADFRARTLEAVGRLGLADDVVFTGRVPEGDLPAYYSGALCLVLPSFCEGFGLPPLEAMACGCPVVVADTDALREVASGAALLVEPHDPASIESALASLVANPRLRTELSQAGRRRAALFSWQRTARETAMVYELVERQDARSQRTEPASLAPLVRPAPFEAVSEDAT